IIMSDSADSTVTYTIVSSPFGGLSNIGSSGVDRPPVMPEDPYAYVVANFHAPPSPDYVSGPEYLPSPDFVPELVYPEFMPPKDEVLLAEEQPLPVAVSPTTDSPGYVPESDPEEDPEEDDDKDPKEDHADYPADGGNDGDDEDESSDDDEDDDVDIEEDEEEEEHPAPTDSTTVALPAVDQAPSAKKTELFETDESAATPPHPTYRVTASMSIREPPTPFWSEAEVVKLLVIPSPPLLPLSPWSSPLPQIHSPPLPVSPLPLPLSPTYPLGYRAMMIWLRAEAPSTSYSPPPHIILSHTRADTPPSGTPPSGTPPLKPIPLPTSSPPLHLLSTDRRADRPEVTLLPHKRLGIALGPRYEVGESSSAPIARLPGGFRADYGFVAIMKREIMRDVERDVSYGITDTWDEMLVDIPGAPVTDETELGQRMTNFVTTIRQDTNEIYVRLDDEQTERQLMVGQLNIGYVVMYSGGSTTCSDYRATGNRPQEAGGDYRDAGSITAGGEAVHRGAGSAERSTLGLDDRGRETTGTSKGPAQPDALEEAGSSSRSCYGCYFAMINQVVTAALAARDANRSTNGYDSHNSGTGVRRTEQAAH
ncbi:hypothetical protein Tco_0930378, partial [Tanacetum coccineum]